MDIKEAKKWIEKTCGKGWFPLIEEVYARLPSGVTITTVYQKWGALRFDCDLWDDKFEEYLEEVEEKSMKTCEVCGKQGGEKIVNDWVETLCEEEACLESCKQLEY